MPVRREVPDRHPIQHRRHRSCSRGASCRRRRHRRHPALARRACHVRLPRPRWQRLLHHRNRVVCTAEGSPRGPPAAEAAPAPEGGLAARTRARHAEIHAALARGLTITEISRTLRLERKTVRRYATAADAGQLIGGARLARPDLLDPHRAYLQQRWDEGARSTERLHQELRDRGYRGSLRTLRRLTARLRRDTAVPRATTRTSAEEGGPLDPHPARRSHRRRPRRARADHRPLRRAPSDPRPGPRLR